MIRKWKKDVIGYLLCVDLILTAEDCYIHMYNVNCNCGKRPFPVSYSGIQTESRRRKSLFA